MPPTKERIESDLDRLYWSDSERYQEHLETIKGIGYKVLRNSKGQHKIQADLSAAFGGDV